MKSRRKRSGFHLVLDTPPQDVPWLWQALAVLALGIACSFVSREARGTPQISGAEAGNRLVCVNFGTQAELESLPGIGPALARAIMAGRPYSKMEDLERVKGISPVMIRRMMPLIRVGWGRRAADR